MAINQLQIIVNLYCLQVAAKSTVVRCLTYADCMPELTSIDYDHVDGAGLMEQLDRNGCHSKFDIYIPHHYARFPFVLLVTRGRHAHPPPPPRKTPKAIADQIKSILEQRDCLDLTTRKFGLNICIDPLLNYYRPIPHFT